MKKAVFKNLSKKCIIDNQIVRCSVWIYSIYKHIQYGCSLYSNHIIDREKKQA